MTLIITELRNDGIVMVADSAVTFEETAPTGNRYGRVRTGVKKLQMIPYLHAGISMWGCGTIEDTNTDIWIEDFIDMNNSHGTSRPRTIPEFAERLMNKLNETAKDLNTPAGFHIAGFTEIKDRQLPTFFHTRNSDGLHGDYRLLGQFVIGDDHPPKLLPDSDPVKITRNGDYGPYAVLIHGYKTISDQINYMMGDLAVPHPSIEGRMIFHMAWIRFVSELYRSITLTDPTIAGPFSVLGIPPQGELISKSY